MTLDENANKRQINTNEWNECEIQFNKREIVIAYSYLQEKQNRKKIEELNKYLHLFLLLRYPSPFSFGSYTCCCCCWLFLFMFISALSFSGIPKWSTMILKITSKSPQKCKSIVCLNKEMSRCYNKSNKRGIFFSFRKTIQKSNSKCRLLIFLSFDDATCELWT